MTILAISPTGNLTLEQDLLAHLGLRQGQKIDVEKLPNGELKIRAVSAAPKGSIENLIGMHKGAAIKSLSIEEMNEIIAEKWANS